MPVSENKTRIIITLDKALAEKIKENAEKENRTVSNYVETLLKNNLEDKESK